MEIFENIFFWIFAVILSSFIVYLLHKETKNGEHSTKGHTDMD